MHHFWGIPGYLKVFLNWRSGLLEQSSSLPGPNPQLHNSCFIIDVVLLNYQYCRQLYWGYIFANFSFSEAYKAETSTATSGQTSLHFTWFSSLGKVMQNQISITRGCGSGTRSTGKNVSEPLYRPDSNLNCLQEIHRGDKICDESHKWVFCLNSYLALLLIGWSILPMLSKPAHWLPYCRHVCFLPTSTSSPYLLSASLSSEKIGLPF